MRRPFIVAELSCNHLGSVARAYEIVRAAARAGADAFKVQVWKRDTMCIDHTYVLERGPWAGRSLVDLYREAWTPWDWLPALFAHCRELGMEPFGAAFDAASVDYLETLGVKRHKVASFELVDLPLIRYMASKGKPMILSTGMATEDEIGAARAAAEAAPGRHRGVNGYMGLTVLKCTSAYPADARDAHLATFEESSRWIWSPDWGVSDHTHGIGVAVAATALGATMIEKHLTLRRADGGPDAGFSMEPDEFAQMVTECRRAAAAIGTVKYGPGPNESTELRRSLWVTVRVRKGEPLTLGGNVATARPALGLPCSTVLDGVVASRDLEPRKPLTQADLLEAPR